MIFGSNVILSNISTPSASKIILLNFTIYTLLLSLRKCFVGSSSDLIPLILSSINALTRASAIPSLISYSYSLLPLGFILSLLFAL
jgi:hypothetical protein